MGTGVEVPIDAPPLAPFPSGLLNSAVVIDQTDDRWINGVRLSPENGDNATVFDPCSTTADGFTRNRKPVRTFAPFGVEAYDECSTFGFSRADYEGRARRALAARASKAVEAEFATGTIQAANVHFQDGGTNTTTLGGAALGTRSALDAAVQAIADNNLGIGMIHARPSLVTAWTAKNMLRWANGKLYTLVGNLVVPGAGYTGAKPDGTAATATSEWLYVTGPVQVLRGPVEVFVPEADHPELVDRVNNLITVRAQQMHVVVGNFNAVIAINCNSSIET